MSSVARGREPNDWRTIGQSFVTLVEEVAERHVCGGRLL